MGTAHLQGMYRPVLGRGRRQVYSPRGGTRGSQSHSLGRGIALGQLLEERREGEIASSTWTPWEGRGGKQGPNLACPTTGQGKVPVLVDSTIYPRGNTAARSITGVARIGESEQTRD